MNTPAGMPIPEQQLPRAEGTVERGSVQPEVQAPPGEVYDPIPQHSEPAAPAQEPAGPVAPVPQEVAPADEPLPAVSGIAPEPVVDSSGAATGFNRIEATVGVIGTAS